MRTIDADALLEAMARYDVVSYMPLPKRPAHIEKAVDR